MEDKRIARFFPRKTRATPDDALAFTSVPPRDGIGGIDEVMYPWRSPTICPKLKCLQRLGAAWASPFL